MAGCRILRAASRFLHVVLVVALALLVPSARAAADGRSEAAIAPRDPPGTVRAPLFDRTEPARVARRAVRVRRHSAGAETAALPLAAPTSRTVNADGAWCWFADPRAVRHRGAHDRTYLGWITRIGDVQIGQYDHAARVLTTATLMTRFKVDDHNNPVVVIRPDGRLMAFWSGHVGARIYYRVSTQPEDIAAWGPTRILPVQLTGASGYTYPNPVFSAAEGHRLYLFWRAGWQPAYSTSGDLGQTWAPARQVVTNAGERPYVKVAGDPAGGVHLAFTDGHPRETDVNNIHYVRIKDGRFVRANGTVIGSVSSGPIRPNQADTVYNQAQWGGQKAWVHDVAVDPAGRPVIVFATFVSLADHRYRYARWTGSGWSVHRIVLAGGSFERSGTEQHYSGGLTLDHEDPRVVYLSREINGVHEVERWATGDGGATWSRQALTSGSSRPNVRPVSPRGSTGGALEALWMAGDYAFYTSFSTAIRGTADPQETRRLTQLRISVDPATVFYGRSTVVGARLVDDQTGATIGGQQLRLWVRTRGSVTFQYLGSGVTDSVGLVRWRRYPTTSADYEVRFAGTATLAPSVSRRIPVTVTPA